MALIRISGKHAELKRGAIIGSLSVLGVWLLKDLLDVLDFGVEVRIFIVAAFLGALIHKYVVG